MTRHPGVTACSEKLRQKNNRVRREEQEPWVQKNNQPDVRIAGANDSVGVIGTLWLRGFAARGGTAMGINVATEKYVPRDTSL